jgi:heme o synthase
MMPMESQPEDSTSHAGVKIPACPRSASTDSSVPPAGPLAKLRVFTDLTKFKLVTLSALSTATGYVVSARGVGAGVMSSSLGVLILALGACALNQFQDRKIDAQMRRTSRRPLPAGRLRPGSALAIAVSLIVSGFVFLWLAHGAAVAGIGMSAVILYNGLYAYLKRIWAFAAVPGAMIGALPPLIGWMAAGGGFYDPRALALSFFFFIWQVPHFWLLLFIFGEDYKRAGLPSLIQVFGLRQRAGLTFIWMLTAASSSLLLPVYGVTSSPWISFALLACSIWLAWRAATLRGEGLVHKSPWRLFRSINIYALCVMVLLIVDALTRSEPGR